MSKIGIIAGAGEFPLILVRKCIEKGVEPVVVAIKEEADESLNELVDGVFWQPVGKVGKILKFLRTAGVSEAIAAGKVNKMRIFRDIKPDLTAMRLLWSLRDRKDDTIMNKVADLLAGEGVTLLPQTRYMEDYLPEPEVFTKRTPTEEEKSDIEFGFHMAKEIGSLDIGQTVVVKRRAVLAVEAIEGSDSCILRGGSLGNGDVVVIKVSKPNQDLRFDVPAIGLQTIKSCIDARVKILAIEARKTFFFQKTESVRLANRHNIAIVSF
jgi:DUF1009 family protein